MEMADSTRDISNLRGLHVLLVYTWLAFRKIVAQDKYTIFEAILLRQRLTNIVSKQSGGGAGDEREKSSEDRKSGRLAHSMRRASRVFNRISSERGLNKSESKREGLTTSQSSRNLSSDPSSPEAMAARLDADSNSAARKIGSLVQSSGAAIRSLGNQIYQTSSRKLAQENSSRNLSAEPVDDEQKTHPALSKLPAAGFNRLKTMWANRESMSGFSSPLSTWSRPYGVHKKNGDGDVKVTFDPKSKTYSGKFDADKVGGNFVQFGCSIEKCPRTQLPNYKESIPNVLILLRDELEKQNGFLVEGVFRVAASFEDQKAYKIEVDNGSFKGCRSQDDAMCMAALLKEWFRTMPVRLLNVLPHESIQTGVSDYKKELPEPNLSVFLWLCDLMADIVALEQVNRMNARAMAIVIAPNLYMTDDDATPQEIVQEMNGAVSIVEAALKDCIAKRKGQ